MVTSAQTLKQINKDWKALNYWSLSCTNVFLSYITWSLQTTMCCVLLLSEFNLLPLKGCFMVQKQTFLIITIPHEAVQFLCDPERLIVLPQTLIFFLNKGFSNTWLIYETVTVWLGNNLVRLCLNTLVRYLSRCLLDFWYSSPPSWGRCTSPH